MLWLWLLLLLLSLRYLMAEPFSQKEVKPHTETLYTRCIVGGEKNKGEKNKWNLERELLLFGWIGAHLHIFKLKHTRPTLAHTGTYVWQSTGSVSSVQQSKNNKKANAKTNSSKRCTPTTTRHPQIMITSGTWSVGVVWLPGRHVVNMSPC